jgi:hypothetical protein
VTARSKAFVGLCLAATLCGASYVYVAHLNARAENEVEAIPEVLAIDPTGLETIRRHPHLAFRNMAPGNDYGKLSFASLDETGQRRSVTSLSCTRVYFRGGRGVCLATAPNKRLQIRAYILDDGLVVRHGENVFGVPSRTRISPDGRLGAFTVFVGRDSYSAMSFSTRTRLIDMTSGETIADLEDFEAWQDGASFRSVDFNYWGVTFGADSNRFFATLATRRHTYLVQGDVKARRVTVIHDGIECPSLSPDGTRIAFKKRAEGTAIAWHPAVFDLTTRTERVLSDEQAIDDQIEWLDNQRVAYGIRTTIDKLVRSDIWVAPTDGSASPAILLHDAESPAVVMP